MKYCFLPTIFICLVFILMSYPVYGQNESEPNNSFETANNFVLDNLNVTIQGTIPTNNDVDIYAIEVNQAGIFRLNVINVDPNIDMRLTLFDSEQNEVEQDLELAGEPVDLEGLVCDANTYYIRVEDGGNDSSGSEKYNLSVLFDVSDVYECNQQFDEAALVEVGELVKGAIGTIFDEDFYRIEIEQPGLLEINVSNIKENVDMNASLFDANQNLLVSENKSNSNSVELSSLVCDIGTYYIQLRNNNFTFSPALYNLTTVLNVGDLNECNNDFETATSIQICDTTFATFNIDSDEDFYRFDGVENETINIQISNVPDDMNLRVFIYDAWQNNLGDFTANVGQNFSATFIPAITDAYYLRIYNDTTNEDTQAYSLTLFDNTCPLTGIKYMAKESIQIYPNPSQNEIFVTVNDVALANGRLTIYSAVGKQLYTTITNNGVNKLNIEAFPEGILLVEFVADDVKVIQKLVKE